MKINALRRYPQGVILGGVMMAAMVGEPCVFLAHQEQSPSAHQVSQPNRLAKPWQSSVGPISGHLEAAAAPNLFSNC